jgi:hypothetical protein
MDCLAVEIITATTIAAAGTAAAPAAAAAAAATTDLQGLFMVRAVIVVVFVKFSETRYLCYSAFMPEIDYSAFTPEIEQPLPEIEQPLPRQDDGSVTQTLTISLRRSHVTVDP